MSHASLPKKGLEGTRTAHDAALKLTRFEPRQTSAQT
jgi:hypothetical protein